MARLDRLPQVREVAQLGSVLGREFAYEMLSGLVHRRRDARCRRGSANWSRRSCSTSAAARRGPDTSSSTRWSRTRPISRSCGAPASSTTARSPSCWRASFRTSVEAQPELLARHYTEAGSASKAVTYWQQRGRTGGATVGQSGGDRPPHQWAGGPRRDAGWPRAGAARAGPADDDGPALIATKGFAAPEVEPAYRRALELCEELGDTSQQFSALHGTLVLSLCPS